MPSGTPIPFVAPVRIADIELCTVLDRAFLGEYVVTPTLHSHPYDKLLCGIFGETAIDFVDGSTLPMTAGVLCILPPGLYHQTRALTPAAQKLAVQFEYFRVESSLPPLYKELNQMLSLVRIPLFFPCPEICLLMEQLREEMLHPSVASAAMEQALMTELYILLLRSLLSRTEEDMRKTVELDSAPRYYRQIESFFATRHISHTTAEELAAELRLSRRQLSF